MRGAGVYTFSLVVNDGYDDSTPVTTTVTAHAISAGYEHVVAKLGGCGARIERIKETAQ